MDGICPDGGSDNLAGEEGTFVCLRGGGFATWCKMTLLPGYPLKYTTRRGSDRKAAEGIWGSPVLAEVHEAISVREFFITGAIQKRSRNRPLYGELRKRGEATT